MAGGAIFPAQGVASSSCSVFFLESEIENEPLGRSYKIYDAALSSPFWWILAGKPCSTPTNNFSVLAETPV
ncbi:MAG: hypothetical protein HC812_06570 [Leptolyngbya sp. RL_3_1]|nr:hypothetical protein [Leptolyngbya sp. RL_3_1]